ncbi:MAG: Mth938-like domain-containing protein [Rhodobacteraceae bacterium]|nr:Mth938-like domain-containing protein [Paracoccaceae bacterium]
MRLNETTYDDAQPVEGYGPGFFRIADEVFHGPILTLASGTKGWEGYGDLAPLLALKVEIDVLFVGTGAEISHIPKDMRDTLEAAGIGVEAMSTPSACRTYNVLLSEGRRVALAVIPV